eukprot:3686579-Pleurochrysis_carterae.AAC.6
MVYTVVISRHAGRARASSTGRKGSSATQSHPGVQSVQYHPQAPTQELADAQQTIAEKDAEILGLTQQSVVAQEVHLVTGHRDRQNSVHCVPAGRIAALVHGSVRLIVLMQQSVLVIGRNRARDASSSAPVWRNALQVIKIVARSAV